MNEEKAEYLPIEKLHPFEEHPFKVKDDEEMDRLQWSICTEGMLTPVVVRPMENGEYEVISGHRRIHACRKAGIRTVPALIRSLDRDAAAIAVVDSNLHREHILPSEKAFAYKMKMDAMNRQGKRTDLTSNQVGRKLETADLIAEQNDDSKTQVRRYIRLTHLIPGILQKVDEGQIALTPAVALSYLTEPEQSILLEAMECADCTPSLSQAVQLKKFSQAGTLDSDIIRTMMNEPKANQQEKISFRMTDIRKYFPKSYSAAQIQETILTLLQNYERHRRQDRSR